MADIIGKCPLCGNGQVVATEKAYGCDHWKTNDGGCKFVVWKNMAKKEITPEIVKEILTKGETEFFDDFVSRKGEKFSAKLVLSKDKTKVEFIFPERKQ